MRTLIGTLLSSEVGPPERDMMMMLRVSDIYGRGDPLGGPVLAIISRRVLQGQTPPIAL